MFDGDDYQPDRDKPRLAKQIKDVLWCLEDGKWHSVAQISARTGHPITSVSAQIRNLRKKKMGGYNIERAYRGNGLYVFRWVK